MATSYEGVYIASRKDKEFTDVTLACEDGQQVEAHKVVLIASSPFFLNILKRNKHPHPLIYMKGVKSENLSAMVDFFYHGGVKVFQENLDAFLVLAKEFQLKGLEGNQTEKEYSEVLPQPTKNKNPSKLAKETSKQYSQSFMEKDASFGTGIVQQPITETVVAVLTDHTTTNTNIESLDQQIKSVTETSSNAYPYDKRQGRARICKVCGKEGSWTDIKNHIEDNHITGISISCDLCGQVFKSRNALKVHKSRKHRHSG